MGKIKQGILGGFSGKVGPVIGSSWKGKAVMRAQALSHNDPQTQAQLMQRAKFGLMGKFISKLAGIINYGFKNAENGTTAQNEGMSYNILNAVTGTYPSFEVAYGDVQLSTGALPNVDSPSATDNSSGHIMVNWTNNGGEGSALNEDSVMLAFFNKNKQAARCVMGAADRESAVYDFTTPTAWSGDTVHVYVFTKSAKSSDCSRTIHIGSVIAS